MKAEFRNIRSVVPGQCFLLYGNYKKSFGVFCEFIGEKLIASADAKKVEVKFCSVSDCKNVISTSGDLFEEKILCICIREIEDKHLELLENFLGDPKYVFVLECGDFMNAKKITEYFQKHRNFLAIASFKNTLTFSSICRMIFPTLPASVQNEITELISNTDEDLSSIVRKIRLLPTAEDLQNFFTYQKSFLADFNSIQVIRFFLQKFLREKFIKKEAAPKNAISYLLDAELKVKCGLEIPKSYIYKYLP